MPRYLISFSDSRFEDTGLTSGERVELLRQMVEDGAFDLRDEFVSGLSIRELPSEAAPVVPFPGRGAG